MTNKQIADSNNCISGNMICKSCGKKIEGLYLIVEHYISKRGNEDDYNELFCYDCTKKQAVWTKFELEQQQIELKKKKDLKINKNKAIEIIKESNWIDFSVDVNGKDCIIYKKFDEKMVL